MGAWERLPFVRVSGQGEGDCCADYLDMRPLRPLGPGGHPTTVCEMQSCAYRRRGKNTVVCDLAFAHGFVGGVVGRHATRAGRIV